MSRTYRRDIVYLDLNHRPMPIDKEEYERVDEAREYHEMSSCDYYSKRNSKCDRKSWRKSDSSFKQVMKKTRKAKERKAMQNEDYENIPYFKRENDWLYN